MMRVTQRNLSAGVEMNLQASMARTQRLQEKLSSGRELARPSDSPTDVSVALEYRATIRRSDQLIRNADDGLDMLSAADTALTGTLDVLRRARELAIRGANATLSTSDREAMAIEVDRLREQTLSFANTQHLGRPLFSGTAGAAAGGDTAYTTAGVYNGDGGSIERTIAPGLSVPVNVTGPAAFGPAGANVFSALTKLAADLRTAPSQLAPNDVAAIDDSYTRLTATLATVGARMNHVESVRSQTDTSKAHQSEVLGRMEGVDIAKTVLDLQLQQTAYQAALASAARVIQPSLLDFLR